MRVINDNDVKTVTDTSGDSITLLVSVRHADVLRRDEMETKEGRAGVKELGMTIQDMALLEKQATAEEKAAAVKRREKQTHSGDVRRFMLQAVAQKLTISGRDIGGQEIVAQYDRMDPDSAAWVDAQVAEVWEPATLTDEEKKPLAVSPSLS